MTPTISKKFLPQLTSRSGNPVLVWDGEAYRSSDYLPTGETAAEFIRRIDAGRGRVAAKSAEHAPECVEGYKVDGPAPTDLLAIHPLVAQFLA